MKKIGMIGGLGPESTLDDYNQLIRSYREKSGSINAPEIIVYSMDLTSVLNLIDEKKYDVLIEKLVQAINSIYRAGADFAFISANTPHVVFEEVNKLSPIPLISIIEETCKKVKECKVKKAGLLGTEFTMKSDFYKKAAESYDLEIVIPEKEEQLYIQDKLMSEIELGIFLDETRNGLLGIIKRMIDDEKIDGIILGCTELPLILTKSEFGIEFFNTTKIHVDSIIEYYTK